jgi:hypothetical protein
MKISRSSIVLGGVAAVLAVALLAEVIAGPSSRLDPLSAAAAAPAPRAQAAAVPAAIGPDRSVDLRPDLLARPPFSLTRKPDAVPVAVEGQVGGQPPRLAGILVSGGIKRAIFQPPGKRPPIIASEGATVAGWTVEAITAETVAVTGPTGALTLRPKLDPELTVAAQMFGGQPAGAAPPANDSPAANPLAGAQRSPPPLFGKASANREHASDSN